MLSDKLITIGTQANAKSNLSMATKAQEMLDEVKLVRSTYSDKQLYNIIKHTCSELNKSGFNYYKPEVFYL